MHYKKVFYKKVFFGIMSKDSVLYKILLNKIQQVEELGDVSKHLNYIDIDTALEPLSPPI